MFSGNEWKHIPFEEGGRQGGTDTPHIWIRLLDLAVRRSRVRWKDENLGVEYCSSLLEPFVLDCLIWADDMVMCASSFENIKRMFCNMTEEIMRIGLSWKPSSLHMIRASVPWASTSLSWEVHGMAHKIHLVSSFQLLGVMIDSTGSDSAALNRRIAQAWVHFH